METGGTRKIAAQQSMTTILTAACYEDPATPNNKNMTTNAIAHFLNTNWKFVLPINKL